MAKEHTEYAAAERGFEDGDGVEWQKDLLMARFENAMNVNGGLDSRVIERTVTVSDWRELSE